MITVRIVFSKTGKAKYISHLDLMRAMTRAVRRAGIPLWYTEGFNRHPYITFASPISLGFEGLQETMDLRLEQEMSMDELTSRMDAVMPEGIRVLSAHEAVMKAGDLLSARYRITVPCNKEQVEELLAQNEILVEKRTKKKTMKTLDIRPSLQDVSVFEQGENTVIEVTLPCGSNETVNPALLITALGKSMEDEQLEGSVVRLATYGKNGELFA